MQAPPRRARVSRPFAFGPLVAAIARNTGRHLHSAPRNTSCPYCLSGVCCTLVYVAQETGIDAAQVYRWRRSGLTVAQADELATRAGMHPSEVWGAHWWSA